MDKEKLLYLFEGFKSLRVLVVGDVMLDRYVFGRVERISPEAPVPVVEVEKEEFRLGGAGNVANNLASLGVETYLCGVVGQDYQGHIVKGLLKERGIKDLTLQDPSRPTTEKTRIIAQSQQLLRIDNEVRERIEGKTLQRVLESLELQVDGLIVSDYAKGLVCQELMERVRSKGVFFAVDPRPQNKSLYRGASLMTPNEKEAKAMHPAESLEKLGWAIKRELELESLVITLGPRGMALFEKDLRIYPARAKQVYDVSGAGDTVVAALTACRLLGVDWDTACEFANLCAGIVVGKLGTSTVEKEEVLSYIEEGCRI